MRAAACIGVLLILLAAPVAHADCPTSTLNCGSPQSIQAAKDSCAYSDCSGSGRASFDAMFGRVAAFAQGGTCGTTTGATSVETEDEFQVTGLTPGTPVTFFAKLALQILTCPGATPGCCAGSASAFLRDENQIGDDFSTHNAGASCASLGTELQITIQVNAGQPFRITYGADAGGQRAASGSIMAALHFSGLPTGAAIVSCRGFVQSFPVPAGPNTWARIKALYRN